MVKDRFSQIHQLVINQDNGPENHSRRTQFLYRILSFAHQSQLNLKLAYYPPYHSKYNPVERTFGSKFQKAGIIHYKRGLIQIVSHQKLEAASCECYRRLVQEYERLIGTF